MTLKQILTVTAHILHPPNQRVIRGYAASIAALFLLGEQIDWTLLEITRRLNQAGWPVTDSTVSPRLSQLKNLGVITDELAKRPCRITMARKKAWGLNDGARELISITHETSDESTGRAR